MLGRAGVVGGDSAFSGVLPTAMAARADADHPGCEYRKSLSGVWRRDCGQSLAGAGRAFQRKCGDCAVSVQRTAALTQAVFRFKRNAGPDSCQVSEKL